jgi:hypothetical protein
MTEQPRMFTAPVTGRYHFVGGQEPHLVEDCTAVCSKPFDGRFVAVPGVFQSVEFDVVAGSTVGFMNSGIAVEIPEDTLAIAYHHGQ